VRRPWGEVVAGVAGVVLGVAATAGAATSAGPEGAWETLDDRTGMPRAVVRVAIRETELAGVIERGYWGPFYRTQSWRRAGGNEAESPGPGEKPEGRRP
jgi:hypothetical protein